MLITKQDLDLINDFVENNKSLEGTYTFPHIDKQISDYLKEPAEFIVRNHYKNYYAQIWTERVTLMIVQEGEFVWKLFLKKPTLQGFMDAQHLVNLMADHKITITETYINLESEIKRLIEFDELYRLSKWGLDYLNNFFGNFSPAHGGNYVDTEESLKVLNKAKFEEWNNKIFYKSHDGKRESIDYYHRLFNNFKTCVERIKNLQLHDIRA